MVQITAEEIIHQLEVIGDQPLTAVQVIVRREPCYLLMNITIKNIHSWDKI